MLFLIKHFYNFLKIDILLFKSLEKVKIISFIGSFFVSWLLLFFLKDSYLKYKILSAQNILFWCFFTFFFTKLKKQHFFHHMVINRVSFYVLPEILLFLASIYTYFFITNVIFILFLGINNINNFITITISAMIDSFLFVICKIRKYTLFQIFTIIIMFFFLKEWSNINEILLIDSLIPWQLLLVINVIKIIFFTNEIKKNNI